MPFFSIIIPTLNEEKSIPKLLKDLSKQSFREFEVLIIDGKSEDQTKQAIQPFEDKVDLKFISSKRRNLCFQRNLGGECAQGKYLIFLDADVRIYQNYLKEIYSTIRKKKARFITTYQLPDVKSSFDLFLIQIANYTLETLVIINKQMAPGYNFIVEKILFEAVDGFDEEAVFSEDHELSMRIWKKKRTKILIIKKPLLKWSFRRLRKDGRFPIIYKYSLAMLHMLLIGKITNMSFTYPMGGEYFSNLEQLGNKNLLSRFKREIKRIIELE